MTPAFDKSKLESEMLAYFERLYKPFPEILTKIISNHQNGDHWNKNMTEAEIRQTVRVLDETKKRNTNIEGVGK